VFWVDVGKTSTAMRDFVTIAKILGHSIESILEELRVREALRVLENTKQTWLLILDNADYPGYDYQEYFPSGTQGAVLMTSRVSECKQYSPDAYKALEGLGDKDSKELLLKAADIPEKSWPAHSNQAEKVVQLLGSHTLALIQAGAYIAQGHCQLHQYPKEYQRQRERLLKYKPKQAQSRYCDVYTTFEASAEVLEQSESKATKDAICLLKILSMLDPGVLPLQMFKSAWEGCRAARTNPVEASDMDALTKGHVSRLPSFMVAEGDEWDPYRLVEARSLLVSLSLVIRHDLDDLDDLVGLSMHPLAHAWAKDRQDPEQQGVYWVTAGCVLALSRRNSMMWQTQERRLLPHIQSYLDVKISRVLSFGSEAILVPILLQCGWTLLDMRQDSRLSHLLEDMFTELRKNPEEPSEKSLPLYDLQARNLLNIGKNKKAVELLEHVVEIRETTLFPDNPRLLGSQHHLANAYEADGQVKDAVKLLKHVVEIRETTLFPDHPRRLGSQHALAIAYQANGQVKEAVKLLEQVVEIRRTTLFPDHPDRLGSQNSLASAYQANGQVKEAVELLKHVVEIRGTTLFPDHPRRLGSQHDLAIAYQANGQVKEAVKLLEQVVKIRGTTLAEDHPDRLASQHALSLAYQANGQVKEAVKLLEHVVEIK
jgi:tetratricopeptide (TPR) repeat protein/AraC-like DNA-binding protein